MDREFLEECSAQVAPGGRESRLEVEGEVGTRLSAPTTALKSPVWAMPMSSTSALRISPSPCRKMVWSATYLGGGVRASIALSRDLYGTSVVRASRIVGQADGGQILVSQVGMDLVEIDAKRYASSCWRRQAPAESR